MYWSLRYRYLRIKSTSQNWPLYLGLGDYMWSFKKRTKMHWIIENWFITLHNLQLSNNGQAIDDHCGQLRGSDNWPSSRTKRVDWVVTRFAVMEWSIRICLYLQYWPLSDRYMRIYSTSQNWPIYFEFRNYWCNRLSNNKTRTRYTRYTR